MPGTRARRLDLCEPPTSLTIITFDEVGVYPLGDPEGHIEDSEAVLSLPACSRSWQSFRADAGNGWTDRHSPSFFK